MRLLLDTSAIVCLVEREFGWEVAKARMASSLEIFISALTVVEFTKRCLARGETETQARQSVDEMISLIHEVIPTDEATAKLVLTIAVNATSRVPTVDSIIAATAIQHSAVLLHRDAHFRSIPQTLLHQEELPAPNSMKAPDSIKAKEGT